MSESGRSAPFRQLLAVATLAVALAGAWLVFVILTVLHPRDPSHVRLWSSVATACGLFSFIGGACARNAAPSAASRVALMLISALLVAAGSYGIAAMMNAPPGKFEGYIVALGAILCFGGLTGILFALFAGRAPRLSESAG